MERPGDEQLRNHERLSWPEIARRTGAGVGTVVRAYRALNKAPEPFREPSTSVLPSSSLFPVAGRPSTA